MFCRKNQFTILAALFFLFLWGNSYAQQTFTELTVKQAIEYALAHNPFLNSLRETVNAKKAEMRVLPGISDPEIAYTREGIANGTFQEQKWSVQQSLEFPTKIIASHNANRNKYLATKAAYEAAQLELKAQVKAAYTQLAYTIEILNLRQKQVELSSEIQRIAYERNVSGETSRLDVLQANLQLSEAQNNLEEATRQFHLARYSFFNILGLAENDQNYGIQFPDTLEYNVFFVDQEELLAALDNYPSVQQYQLLQNAATSSLKASRLAYLPNLRGAYLWQDFGNGFDFNGFEVGISIPLLFAIKQQPAIKVATSYVKEAEFEALSHLQQLQLEAETAWHSFEQVHQQIKNFNSSIRRESAELVALTREAYRVGEVPLINWLETQRMFLNSQENYLTALRDYNLNAIHIEKFLQKDLVYVEN